MVLIIFQFFYSGENSGDTSFKKNNEIAADKEELYCVQLSFVQMHLH